MSRHIACSFLYIDTRTDASGKQIRIPAYEWAKGHPNYYKLLADFALYNSAGEYCPMNKVALNIPDSVPILDANGNRSTMAIEDYVYAELKGELEMRDSLAAKMGDKDSGIIGAFIREAKKQQSGAAVSRKVSSYWYPEMTGDEIGEVKGIAQSEARKTNNYLGIHQKWLYNTQKGHEYFALYSDIDADAPTVLYACKNNRARVQYDYLMAVINEKEDVDNEFARGSAVINAVLDSIKNADSRGDSHHRQAVGAGGNSGNAALHSRNRGSRLDPAFVSCLENFAKIQKQYGVDDYHQFAIDIGNMPYAQQLVYDAAENAGYPTRGYRQCWKASR